MSFQTMIAPACTNIFMNQWYLKHTSFECGGGGEKKIGKQESCLGDHSVSQKSIGVGGESIVSYARENLE